MNNEILACLQGKCVDTVHCTIHSELVHSFLGEAERWFRNNGFTIAEKGVSAYVPVMEDITIEMKKYWQNSGVVTQTLYKTPVGTLSERKEIGPDGSLWVKEYGIKTIEDIPVLKYIIEHIKYYPNYDAITDAEGRLGDDGIVVCRLMRSPLQSLLIEWIGPEQTILLLFEYPDVMTDLMQFMRNHFFQAIELTAKSPARIAWSAENITSILTSPTLFEKYCLPFYNEVAAIMHANGKLYGVHLDGNLAALKALIARSGLDFIEGFTPPPMGDLDMKEAMAAWPSKVLWVNFPGSVFVEPEQAIIDYTVKLLKDGMGSGQFLLTIAEDLPDWRQDLNALGKGIKAYQAQKCSDPSTPSVSPPSSGSGQRPIFGGEGKEDCAH
ncbi:MAG: uroporphyrinogen decarboxylase family protein [bacterium]